MRNNRRLVVLCSARRSCFNCLSFSAWCVFFSTFSLHVFPTNETWFFDEFFRMLEWENIKKSTRISYVFFGILFYYLNIILLIHHYTSSNPLLLYMPVLLWLPFFFFCTLPSFVLNIYVYYVLHPIVSSSKEGNSCLWPASNFLNKWKLQIKKNQYFSIDKPLIINSNHVFHDEHNFILCIILGS